MLFSVGIADLGDGGDDLVLLKPMFRIRFYADFIAELILRRNVYRFLDCVADDSLYEVYVQMAVHEHFGVGFDEDNLFFICHVSKLADVANEYLHQELKWPNRK